MPGMSFNSLTSALATPRLTCFSSTPRGPWAPVSSPPCPGSTAISRMRCCFLVAASTASRAACAAPPPGFSTSTTIRNGLSPSPGSANTRKRVVSAKPNRNRPPSGPETTATESIVPSFTPSSAGTPGTRWIAVPGRMIVSRSLVPESGATGLTGAEKSKTTRVFVGADHDRSPVSVTEAPPAPVATVPAPDSAAAACERAARGNPRHATASTRPRRCRIVRWVMEISALPGR